MNFRNISAWSIRNPVPSLVLFLFLTLAGIVSFMRMDVQNDPDIDFPVVVVAISQPGAAPSELETQVTQRSLYRRSPRDEAKVGNSLIVHSHSSSKSFCKACAGAFVLTSLPPRRLR